MRMISDFVYIALIMMLLFEARSNAQARYAATGPGRYISAGATMSIFETDYGHNHIGGGTVFIDANLTRRVGVELEARNLRLHEAENVHFSTFLVGLRVSSRARRVRPYAKLLVGRAYFSFPFGDAKGSYFVAAPGAGLDWYPRHERRFSIRVIDVECQQWPNFTFGSLRPYGISTGVTYRLF